MSKPEAITEIDLETVTGGRRMLFGAQGGSFAPGLFPRFRQMAQGTWMQSRQAGIAARSGGSCPNGQCG